MHLTRPRAIVAADVEAPTPESKDLWGLLYDLLFSVPHPVLIAIAYVVAALIIAGLLAIVVRFWRGDRFELGFITIERPEAIRNLQTSVDAISKDDRLKKNVLWAFRERLNEANDIIAAGIEDPAVHSWCRGILTDTVTALSEGGHDRHRASLWVKCGDGAAYVRRTRFSPRSRRQCAPSAQLDRRQRASNERNVHLDRRRRRQIVFPQAAFGPGL